ncbi:transposase domain-containing protein [Rhizobium sp. 9140]|uniref:transposase domain-containing protein n=1 Tax=Rhizobium sp. 9140 TaxID=1761900 RepID=UPI000798181E|nr:transposase domain-containing protein [Rhizobium sp. 9140]CZT33019.1 Mu DNA-binding domain-containing protein [Rhizobium sp. 9140]
MKEWFTIPELAEAKLPGLPTSVRRIHDHAARAGWDHQPGKVRAIAKRGGGREYHYSLLPPEARQKIAFLNTDLTAAVKGVSKQLWSRFEALTDEHKAICRKRLDVLIAVDDMKASGIAATIAVQHCARMADIAVTTLYGWRQMVEGHARADWLAALAPAFSPAVNGLVADRADCHADAWATLKSDYLRPEKPKFSSCFRRMMTAAKANGWSPIPSERSLRRRLEAEVPKAVQILARDGKEAAARLFPAQTRSVAHLHAMQMVNTDGHKLDLFVRVPWKKVPVRVILIGIQDIYSRKVLSWILSEAETWEAVRSCIGAMIENADGALPYHIYMDNGRAFASKKISGQATSRNRFKITEGEVAGLLKTLDINAHFTKPYSGRSKPIERAWRDLADEISRHPAMSGAYTGPNVDEKPENYGRSAVKLDALQEHVAAMVEEHNAREGRRTEMADGRSFNAVFAESVADPSTILRYSSTAQRALWMLAAENVTARKPDGAIHYAGNRYWAPVLNQWIGKKLTIRFDPANLHGAIKLYDGAGRFLGDAECILAHGFDCQAAARQTARKASDYAKAQKSLLELNRTIEADQLADLYAKARKAEKRPEAPAPRPVVTRLITGSNLAPAVSAEAIGEGEFENSFSRGLARIMGEGSAIIPFPTGKTAAGTVKPSRKTRAEK